MKKQKIEPALDDKLEKNRPIRNAFFQFKADSAGEILSKILAEATPDDIIGEYIWFLKNLPNMLNNQQSDLVHLVKTELGVDNLKLCGRSNFKGDNYPILDALSCKLGISLRHILAPPTTSCLLCGKDLVSNHKPSQVPLHSVNGPLIASKYGWECKGCRGAGQFRVGQPVSRCFNILIFASKQKKTSKFVHCPILAFFPEEIF